MAVPILTSITASLVIGRFEVRGGKRIALVLSSAVLALVVVLIAEKESPPVQQFVAIIQSITFQHTSLGDGSQSVKGYSIPSPKTTESEGEKVAAEKLPSSRVTDRPRAEARDLPSFATDDFRVRANSLHKTTGHAALVLEVEGLQPKLIRVRTCGWYLLDENGERWDEEGQDTAGLCDGAGGGLDVAVGIRVRTKMVFRAKESSSGTQFTLIGAQLEPWPPGKQILVQEIGAE